MAWNGFHFNLPLSLGLSQAPISEIRFGRLPAKGPIRNRQFCTYHFLLRKDFLHDKNHHKFPLNKAS
jgi:hypothetical protein